jgi:hypothetical protein
MVFNEEGEGTFLKLGDLKPRRYPQIVTSVNLCRDVSKGGMF